MFFGHLRVIRVNSRRNQKSIPNTKSRMRSSHPGNTQKNRMINMKPIQLQTLVNAGDGFLPVIIS